MGGENLEAQRADLRAEKLRREDRKLWLALYHHVNTRGERMRFSRSPFLVPIYKALEHEREVIVEKSVQSGISEAFVVSHLEEAERGLGVLYALPTTELRNEFVQSRVNRLIQRVPYYERVLRGSPGAKADSVVQKHYGQGVIRYVSSDGEAGFKEFPADAVYLDEKDQMDQEYLPLAMDRLGSSKYRLYRAVSNPTIENYGIDVDWQGSSRGTWHQRCECGEWQAIDWFANVVRQVNPERWEPRDREWIADPTRECRVLCRKCEREIPRFGPGQYVEESPSTMRKGFRINKIFGAPMIPLREIVTEFLSKQGNASEMQLFWNSSLGLPYAARGNQIGSDGLDLCVDPQYVTPAGWEGGGACAGVDVGTVLHVVIRRKEREKLILLHAGTVAGEEEMARLMARYSVRWAVIDALPETRMVERAQSRMPFLFKCFFAESVKYTTIDRERRVLTVERTAALDRVKEAVDARTRVDPPSLRAVEDYRKQMSAQLRVTDVRRGRYRWQSTGADHYLLAETYCALALEMAGGSVLDAYVEAFGGDAEEAEAAAAGAGKTQAEIMDEIGKRHGIDLALLQ